MQSHPKGQHIFLRKKDFEFLKIKGLKEGFLKDAVFAGIVWTLQCKVILWFIALHLSSWDINSYYIPTIGNLNGYSALHTETQ